MSNTSRQVTLRRPPAVVIHTVAHIAASGARVESLRRLVATGRYQVNARALARRICQSAGVTFEE